MKFLALDFYTNLKLEKPLKAIHPVVLDSCSTKVEHLPKLEYFYSLKEEACHCEKIRAEYNRINQRNWQWDESLKNHLLSEVENLIDHCVSIQKMSYSLQKKMKAIVTDIDIVSPFANFSTFTSFLHALLVTHFLRKADVRMVLNHKVAH